MVEGLIREREGRQMEAYEEVSDKWGRMQTLAGPVLVLPYDQITRDVQGVAVGSQRKYAYFLPSQLNITGDIAPKKRYRGIFEVVLYSGTLRLEGAFEPLELDKSIPTDAQVHWKNAVLALGIPDLRGLEDQVVLQWDGQSSVSEPGIPVPGVNASGIHVPLDLTPTGGQPTGGHRFHLDVALKGSGSLFFTPVGKVTQVKLASTWPDPSFTGAFLPDEKSIRPDGFNASWKVLNLNRNFPQHWTSDQEIRVQDSAFGVSFLLPADNYQKSTRSVKYAILFIGLTFLCLFFIEMRQARQVHPFQYALIGLALVIFYTLLVSISEHLPFNTAYLIAALMTIGLTGIYARSLFQSVRMGILVSGALAVLYGFLFVTLQQQDYALLIGSIGLFCILAVVMYFSRRVNWYAGR
ncbi:MAG: cell envelope integrity protein CreD [Saprospirales bacterium]|nr:cell envelope integrity protein CreD [Saprospirales bacterium]